MREDTKLLVDVMMRRAEAAGPGPGLDSSLDFKASVLFYLHPSFMHRVLIFDLV